MNTLTSRRFVVTAALALAGCAAVSPQTAAIVGSWKLVSIESVFLDGEITTEWMGPNPSGQIVYLPDGNMSVQFMSDPRPRFTEPGTTPRDVFEKEATAAYNGYYAYWGKYEFDPATQEVRHHIAGSLRPAEVGRTLVRNVRIEGKRLVITTPVFKRRGKDCRNRITFVRAAPGDA